MQRFMILLASCVVLLIVAGCGGEFRIFPDNRSQTEIYRDEVERNITPLEGAFETLDVYDYLVMGYQGQIVVCYTFTQAPAGVPEQGVGVATIEQRGVTQYLVVNNDSIKTAQLPPFIMYDSYHHVDGFVVYGRVFAAEVAAVNVTFDTGKTVRAVPQQGGFVAREAANEVREVQVLGVDDQVLQQYNQTSLVPHNP